MTVGVKKSCTLCGTDLDGQKRIKNASGQYFCPDCWKTQSSVFGDSPAATTTQVVAPPRPTPQTQSGPPAVRIVRSESQPTVAQAAAQGLKEGAAYAGFKIVSKVLFFVQFISALALTKKLFPDANNGMMIIVGLTAGIAAILEIDLVARMIGSHQRWLDAETLKSGVGILLMIGLSLAYALAIFLAVTSA